MRLLTCLAITLTLTTSLLAQTPKPTDSATEAQAKQELNTAARAYREGNFTDAQVHAERALALDPNNKAAPMYVARIIQARYRPGDSTPENAAIARQAIVAYQRIVDRNPNDDEAYKAVTYLYGAIKEEELLVQWILQRANNVWVANDKRAEAFVVLASKDWDCSFKITERHKVTTVDGIKQTVTFQMPKERVEFDRANECANRALEMANMAIVLTPENESAWSYKTNILLELEKLAEMSGELPHKRELHRQYEEALKETTRISTLRKSNP